MLFAVLAVLYGEIGTKKFLSDPGGRLGYAIGTGLGLAIPIILIIWALILRRASRGKIAFAFSLAWLAGTATTFLQMP